VRRQVVNLIPWSPPTACCGPGPFDNTIPFQVPFPYVGSAALLWELQIFGNVPSAPPYVADMTAATSDLPCWTGCSRELTPGCIVPGQSTPMAHTFSVQNCGTGTVTINSTLSNAPALAPYWLIICPCPCPPLSGYCAPLHFGSGCIPFFMGLTDAFGRGGAAFTVGGFGDPCKTLCSVCTQYVTAPFGGIYLSNALSNKLPCNPVPTPCLKSVFAPAPNAVSGSVVAGGVIVCFN
jgi:hypothetical protein